MAWGLFFMALVYGLMWLTATISEKIEGPKREAKRAAERKEQDRRNWDHRLHNAIWSMMSPDPDHWAPRLILESMNVPGHNRRVFVATAGRFTIQELGRAGLVQGDGAELARWIADYNVVCRQAGDRYRAQLQAVTDATAANAARWK